MMINDINFSISDGAIIAHGSQGDPYTVTLKGEGSEDSCTCLGWQHRMNRPEGKRDCKHVIAARKLPKSPTAHG